MISIPISKRLRASAVILDKAGGRVEVGALPQGGPRPALLVNQVTCTPLDEISGLPVCDETIVQVDIWVDKDENSLTRLQELGDEVRRLLEGQRWSGDGYVFSGCQMQRDNITHQPPSKGADTWLHRRSMDFSFTHTNNIAR